jgi:hypothetical protein
VKRGALATGSIQGLFAGVDSANSQIVTGFRFRSDDALELISYNGGYTSQLITSQIFRDTAAWYHLVAVYDTSQSTASNRAKIYVNGVQITAFSTATYPSQNYDGFVNTNGLHVVGAAIFSSVIEHLNGYLSEINFIDGTALTPSSFGETNDDGVWRPIAYTGSHGTNGFYQKYDPTATNGIGHDHSGNGNNFTPSGFTTSGTGTDVMSDTPTTNWCTLLPTSNISSSTTFSNGNLDAQLPTASDTGWAVGSIAVSSGKYYWEVTYNTSNGDYLYVGVGEQGQNGIYPAYVIRGSDGETIDGSSSGSGTSVRFTSGDVIQVALDMDNGKWFIGKNGSYMDAGNGTGNPTAGTGYVHQNLSGTYAPKFYNATGTAGVQSFSFNAGQRAFAYTPPTGFKALNTSNLPAPTVKDGSDYFNTLLYTGTGGTKAVSGAGFQPDFVWIKNRGRTNSSHVLVDAVRGATKVLSSDSTGAEVTTNGTDDFRSFDSDGFTVGDSSNYFVNSIGDTHVAWNWLAGGSTSSNTAGSITSTVSVNPTAGFSIVSYTGNGQSGATVGHGLGVAPSMIIVKDRDASRDWAVYHEALGATKNLFLNLTNSAATDSGVWTNTEPTSTVFTVGTSAYTNYGNLSTGDDFIAYCFAEVESYSKIGSYTGNGSTDGPVVWCGFKPSWVMIKHYSGTITYQENATWNIYDATRDTYNVAGAKLMANASNSEAATTDIDILSNGFKLRGGGDDKNKNGGNYIFVAFASSPFGGSGVSPATAR